MLYSIKLYAWENAFIRRILEVRNHQELRMLKKIGVATVSFDIVLKMNVWVLPFFSH